MNNLLEHIKRLKALSDIGLVYAANDYDRERYEELRHISLRMLETVSRHPFEALLTNLPTPKDYPTAKVDIRGLVLSSEKKILLVQERADGKWSLPGGWADIGYSPSEVVVKEIKEESGLEATCDRLVAVFDKRKHNHPPQAHYVYKLVFACTATSLSLNKGFDVLDVGYFQVDQLPELSEERILKTQIELVYRKVLSGDDVCYFD